MKKCISLFITVLAVLAAAAAEGRQRGEQDQDNRTSHLSAPFGVQE